MAWLKALHIFFMTSWFAGLFYLPRIFVNLAQVAQPGSEQDRLLVMAGKLYRFMGPLALLTLVFGIWLWLAGFGASYGIESGQRWLYAKLALVVVLIGYHHACGRLLARFRAGNNTRTHVWFRVFNEVPALVLLAIVLLVVVKPF
ncbi:MAG TPA: CopD family protein [Burkholderiaceae bacterium]|nr:CopD family protein [Burkholderiaceae bacterium]